MRTTKKVLDAKTFDFYQQQGTLSVTACSNPDTWSFKTYYTTENPPTLLWGSFLELLEPFFLEQLVFYFIKQ